MNAVQLRQDLMYLPAGFELSYHDCDPPNELAMANANFILNKMEAIKLDADLITYTADGGIGISWRSVVTPAHCAFIECGNDGGISGLRSNRSADFGDPEFCKFFWIGEMCPAHWEPGFNGPDEGELVLTLEEALEHIRAYIWADYK